MKPDEFTKLFQAITEVKDQVAVLKASKTDKADIDRVLDSLDALIGKTETPTS